MYGTICTTGLARVSIFWTFCTITHFVVEVRVFVTRWTRFAGVGFEIFLLVNSTLRYFHTSWIGIVRVGTSSLISLDTLKFAVGFAFVVIYCSVRVIGSWTGGAYPPIGLDFDVLIAVRAYRTSVIVAIVIVLSAVAICALFIRFTNCKSVRSAI